MSSAAIFAESLTKEFVTTKKLPGLKGALKAIIYPERSIRTAVENFSVSIKRGEIVGLVGPNGAGKTTLIKMLTGIVVPTEGDVSVLGFEPSHRAKEFRKRIALVMGQKSQLWWDIPAMDSFQLLRRYYELSNAAFASRVEMLGTMLGVTHLFNVHLRKLSLGERMKMELMACLLHEPELCFLDEPTIGLDVVAQKQVRDFFKNYQKHSGVTVILTSHYMADIEALCPRIVLILDGQKRFDGPIKDFEKILGKEKFVSLTFSAPVDRNHPMWSELHPQWEDDGSKVELRIREENLRQVSIELFNSFPVIDYSTEKLPIERVLKALVSNPDLLPGS